MADASGFRNAIISILHRAENDGLTSVDIRSGDLHRRVGGYPGPYHSMPTCCTVMRSVMGANDQVIQSPPKGNGASLVIRYYLPRGQGLPTGPRDMPRVTTSSSSRASTGWRGYPSRNDDPIDLDNLGKYDREGPRPQTAESKPVSPKPVQPPQALTEFTRLLGEIPIDAWNRIVENEPEWQEMQRFLPKYGFGPFAVLMTVCGLNDYQLKGKAEHAYWPPIRELLEAAPAPKSPVGLGATLAEFYEHERLATDKLRRLAQFIRSPLAGELWRSSPEEVSRRLVSIWQDLADVMRQSPEKKTIVFAMKCLAIALLMAGETTFPFERIQIPVDIRINEMTARLGGPTGSDDAVRACWDGVLAGIRRRNPAVTMVHLDSLVWQLAGESGPGRRRYFDSLGVPAAIADRCVDVLEGKSMGKLEEKPVGMPEGMPVVKPEGKSMVARTAGSRRALILIPCSNLKTQPRSPTPGAEPLADLSAARDVLLADLVAKPEFLEFTANRKGIGDPSSPAIPAIDLYSGKLYSAAAKSLRAVAAGKHPDVEVLIVSALYGLVRLTEPIKWYDLTMGDSVGDGRQVYQYWTDTGLWKQLAAFIAEEGITNVWSLLPDSLPYTPYHRVFRSFWARSGQGMPECIHVMAPGVSMATGVRRGRWLNQVLSRAPEHLTAEAPQARGVEVLLDFPIAYRRC